MRIVLGDDHPLCRQATRAAALTVFPAAEIAEAGTFAQTIAALPGAGLVLLDLAMPDMRGLAGLISVASAAPGVPILVITGNEAPGLADDARAAGAHGFIAKSAPIAALCAAIAAASTAVPPPARAAPPADGPHEGATIADRLDALTAAERRVLAAICDGSLNKQVAHRLALSEITVKQHVKAILRKLQVTNRTQAAILMQFRAGEIRHLR